MTPDSEAPAPRATIQPVFARLVLPAARRILAGRGFEERNDRNLVFMWCGTADGDPNGADAKALEAARAVVALAGEGRPCES